MRPKFKLMDTLLLSSEPGQVLAHRSAAKIDADVRARLRITAPTEDHLERMTDAGRLERATRAGTTFYAPSLSGVEAYFAESRRVGEPLRLSQPFKGTPMKELAHWFDDYFSPGSEMGKRIDELGLPGLSWPGGTKWRAAEAVFKAWNYPVLCNYLSYFLVEMLDPQQWVGERADRRTGAVDRLNAMFSSAGLRVHEDGYLVPLLRAPEKKVSLTAWEDEPRFRAEVVQPLLERVPGVLQVVFTHGRDEYGRDFLFCYRHPVSGDRRWIGVQVKAGDVSGAVGRHVSMLVEQVEMAFQHPVKDIAAMGEVYVGEVMVLVSGLFTNNAKERILASIKDPVWRANVSFMDRPAIEGLIRAGRPG